ncbi:MAG: hypothetical protein BM557_01425 [Flavobacterium sp. MedPE-SWcel]|uniref:chorismate-binding protein n=1 Tax=uncultured Flavobacterium sp. TaxID=165435 RepID=UPI00091C83B3|nr:chorismate-binding protein [uncultured Flavobacterium sp.]OIQ22066.1 MAG: hypothetical protein BM557_01425 [Flavobacterium sp. MedPE-SWcel]
MTDIFSRIQDHLAQQKPFVVYTKPKSSSVTSLFQRDNMVHCLNDFNAKGFVFAPFSTGNKVFIPANISDVFTTEINSDDLITASEPKEVAINNKAKEDFESLVTKSVDAIKSGNFDKLVTSRIENIVDYTTDVIAIYKRLLHTYPNAFRYCFYTPETGLWMGATPEQLLKVESDTLHTVALAGTQMYREDEKYIWEEKERDEQQIVTDYIVNSLQGYSCDVEVTKPYTFRAGNIVHIKTDISAKITTTNGLEDIVNKLHPTPAVCGMPKEKAMTFLLENEGYNREYYSGYLGELNHDFTLDKDKNTSLFVNLRCMKLQTDSVQLYIGCGIVKDSNPEKEFFETVNKSMTMRKVL